MTTEKKIRILIVDDHSILRMGLASLIGTRKDIEVSGDADGGIAALKKFMQLKPDVVIMDLVMPGMDGIETTLEIISREPDAKILILTTFGTSDKIAAALRAGALGAIMKNAAFPDLVKAIKTTARGEKVLFIDGSSLFEVELRYECTVDGCHPNDLGMARMADVIGKAVEFALTM